MPCCPGDEAPVVVGNWGDDTHAGQTSTIFALGGRKAQGKPLKPGDPPADSPPEAVDVHVVSAKHSVTTVTITVWSTEYVSLFLDPPPSGEAETQAPDCASKPSKAERQGVTSAAPQRLFTVTCTGGKTLAGWTLEASHGTGRIGEEARFDGQMVSLPHA